MPPFILVSQAFHHLYNDSGLKYFNIFCIKFLACYRYVNYCVPVAVVQVGLIIRRGDGQWEMCDKLIVSVAEFFLLGLHSHLQQ